VVYILAKGSRKTLPYTIALGIYLISNSNLALAMAGLLPSSRVVIDANVIGALIETLMFSIILANRLGELKQATITMQETIIRMQEEQNRLLSEKVAEQTKSLKVLFKELHHRVKNNLQFIQTFLWLKKKRLHDPEGIEALESTERRLHTISFMHEMLYSGQETQVNLKTYIEKFVTHFSAEYPSIRIDLKAVSFQVALDTAVTLGLILNELMTNSIKHAFVQTNEPRITIRITPDGDGLLFVYEDNGSGFDPEVGAGSGLGNMLIRELVKHLPEGVCSYENREGTTIRVKLKCEKKEAAHG